MKSDKLKPGVPTLVVARHAEEAEAFIAKHLLEKARYVFDFRTVVQYDQDGIQVVLLGDYQLRRDWKDLERVLGIRNLLRTAIKVEL